LVVGCNPAGTVQCYSTRPPFRHQVMENPEPSSLGPPTTVDYGPSIDGDDDTELARATLGAGANVGGTEDASRPQSSLDWLKKAAEAVALEESFESTDALLSAARAVYAEAPPVILLPAAEPRLVGRGTPAGGSSPQQIGAKEAEREPPTVTRTESPAQSTKAHSPLAPSDEADGKARDRPRLQLSKPESDDEETARDAPRTPHSESSRASSKSNSSNGSRGVERTSRGESSRPGTGASRRSSQRRATASRPRTADSTLSEVGRRLQRLALGGSLRLSTSQLRVLEVSCPPSAAAGSSTKVTNYLPPYYLRGCREPWS
jgi:hypothetical protein